MSHQHPNNPRITMYTSKRGERVQPYAWPGGYPVLLVTADDSVLCPSCVEINLSQCCNPTDSEWYVVDAAISWETASCDHCSATIEAAYGDDG